MSERPEMLMLNCFELPHDTMTVETSVARHTPIVSITMKNGVDEMTTTSLDEDKVRQLFNWLGVWLHTPR